MYYDGLLIASRVVCLTQFRICYGQLNIKNAAILPVVMCLENFQSVRDDALEIEVHTAVDCLDDNLFPASADNKNERDRTKACPYLHKEQSTVYARHLVIGDERIEFFLFEQTDSFWCAQ